MKKLALILLLITGTLKAADVVLGKLSDLTWTGEGVDRIASFATEPEFAGFIMQVDTEQPGSPNNSMIIQLWSPSTYNFEIDWGEGIIETNSFTDVSAITNIYSTPGVYDIKITGTFPRMYFYTEDDVEKITDIKQWGNIEWGADGFYRTFCGGTNLNVTASDVPNITDGDTTRACFFSCSSLTGTEANWDWVFDGQFRYVIEMFYNCYNFNGDVSGMDVSRVLRFDSMFENCYAFDQPIGQWTVTNATHFNGFLAGATLSVGNYSGVWTNWATQNLKSGVSFHGGNSKYSASAATDREFVATNFNWTIVDGGQE